MTTPNEQKTPEEYAALVHRVLLKHPERHDQAYWAFVSPESVPQIAEARADRTDPSSVAYFPVDCGTTACVAGHVVVAGGYTLAIEIDADVDVFGRYQVDSCTLNPAGGVLEGYDGVEQIEEVAANLLGLGDEQRSYLFGYDRTRPEVLRALRTLAAGDRDKFDRIIDDFNRTKGWGY